MRSRSDSDRVKLIKSSFPDIRWLSHLRKLISVCRLDRLYQVTSFSVKMFVCLFCRIIYFEILYDPYKRNVM